MDWYENWFGSPFYKILYQNRDDNEAQEFVEQLLDLLQPLPGSKMLDIACGEGRFARQLAEHGYDVTGIDLAAASIKAAKESETHNLQFFVQDMRMPFYINFFDYSFNFFTSFGYFRHNRDNALAARSFAAGLKPGGTLVIDYLNYEYVKQHLVAHAEVKRDNYVFHIEKKIERRHIIKDISFTDQENKHRHYRESVAAFGLEDFTALFSAAGMSLVNTFGDYHLRDYDAVHSPRLIMIFKKS